MPPGGRRACGIELLRALSYDTQRGSTPDIRQNFFDGKSAICIDGVWANTEFDQTTTKQEIRYAAFPGPPPAK